MALARGTLTTSPTAVYTSTGNSAITNVYFCNTTASPVEIDVHLATNGTLGDATNYIYRQVSIPAYDTFVLDTEKIVLANGDALYARATAAASVIATVSYLGI